MISWNSWNSWNSSKVEIYIEELVLQGFSPKDRYQIAEAMERELGRLLAERSLPPPLIHGGEVERLDGGSFEIAPSSKAEAIGTQVAQAVYRGLSQ
jgi:hypothetical protein